MRHVMNLTPATIFLESRSSLVMRSTPAVAAQASWMASRGLITGPPDGCIVSHGLCVERQDRADVAEGASVVWLNAHPKLTTAVGQCKQRVVGP